MENSLYIGLSRQMVLRTDMNIIANNVANMNTPGFRGQNTVFEEYISKPRGQEDDMSFVYDYGQYSLSDQGPMQQTNNPFDVALNGPGYLGVEGPGGQQLYTRAGNFMMRTDGTLVTSGGHPVLSAGGGAIVVPQGTKEFKVDDKGVVSTEDGQIGQLQIVEFENIQQLDPLGDNLYTTEAQANPATQTMLKQGYLEGSNVNAVVEMTRMIETLRNYQSVQNMMSSENERLRGAIRKLTGQS